MRILVIGRGWIGRKVAGYLARVGHDVTTYAHTHVDDALRHHPDGSIQWIVNCAGVTGTPNVDACEADPYGTLEGNTMYPIRLYYECEKRGIRFAHVSSGCIYQGTIAEVDAKPNYFGSIYSISKALSDQYLKGKAHVYRVRMPFTNINERKNYLTKVYNYAKYGKLIEGGANSLSHLDDVAQTITELITDDAPNGYYNLVNSGTITMHELVEIMGLTPEWYTLDEFRAVTVAQRSNCVIPSYPTMRPVREALQEALQSIHFE